MRLILALAVGICSSLVAYAGGSWGNASDKSLYKSAPGGHQPQEYSPSNTSEVRAAENWLRNHCENFDTVDAENKFLPPPSHKALYELHRRAARKDPRAQAEIADYYIDGHHVSKDWKTAICWYRAAAQNGSAYGEYWLGIFYQNGWVVKKSATVASHWFGLAETHRESQSAAAETAVGNRFANEKSAVYDMGTALKWYERAAAKHDVNAELALGNFYISSHESSDIHRALSWYGKASAQHSVEADYNIGQIYYRGQGIPQDLTQAHKWLLRAAEKGYRPAQFNLAEMYYRGEGVKEDWVKSYAWLKVSKAADNNPSARELEETLISEFTPAQLKEASKKAHEYRSRYSK